MTTESTSFFKSQIASGYLRDLLHTSYGTYSEKTITTVAVISSVFLTIASGYTTWGGLAQYINSFIAILVTVGIQGLLFISSWRIGFSLKSNEFKISLFFIYIITLFVSVFFSYSSLFNTVYKNEERVADRAISASMQGQKILLSLNDAVEKQNKFYLSDKDYRSWKNKMNKEFDKIENDMENEYYKLKYEHDKLVEKYEKEWKKGGTVYQDNDGKTKKTIPGEGPYHTQYKNDADNFYAKFITSLQKKRDSFNKTKEEIVGKISSYEKSFDINYLLDLNNLCNKIAMTDACSIDMLKDEINKSKELSTSTKLYYDKCGNVDMSNLSFKESVGKVRSCINYAKLKDVNFQDDLLEKLESTEKQEGEHAHHFIVVTNELFRKNPLAIYSLLLAFAIDILVLFCGFLGSRHESFLDISSQKDLLNMQDVALETILDADISINASDKQMIRRMKLILSNSHFDLEAAEKGYPAIVYLEKIEELKLQKELGVFFSMSLAEPIEKKDAVIIGLRTRFILWMCDRIMRKEMSSNTHKNLTSSLNHL